MVLVHGHSWSNKVLELKFLPLARCSVTPSCPALHKPMNCSILGFLVLHYLLEFVPTHVHWFSDAIQPSHPACNLSHHQGLFQWVSSLHQMAKKYWSFNFSISPSNEYSRLISFRIDWFDLLVLQGTLKSLWCSAFFVVQLSHPYMITGKTIALTRWMYVGQVISLVFNMHVSIITVISSSVLCKV